MKLKLSDREMGALAALAHHGFAAGVEAEPEARQERELMVVLQGKGMVVQRDGRWALTDAGRRLGRLLQRVLEAEPRVVELAPDSGRSPAETATLVEFLETVVRYAQHDGMRDRATAARPPGAVDSYVRGALAALEAVGMISPEEATRLRARCEREYEAARVRPPDAATG